MRIEAELKANIDRTQSRQQTLAAALDATRLSALYSGIPEEEIEPLVTARRLELEQQWCIEDAPVRLRTSNGYARDGSETTMDAVNESNRITLRNLRGLYASKLGNHNTTLNEIFAFLNNPSHHQESLEMRAITLRHGYTHTTAARAITHYRQVPVDEQGNILEELCAFWCAARDTTITTSTVLNRTAAFIIALENAVRGENRTSGVNDRDDLARDVPICPVGAGNLLYLAMTSINNGYNAVHPADVYVPVLKGATLEQIAECINRTFREILATRSSVEKVILREQSDCEDEDELTAEQLSCWTRFRDEIVKTTLETLFKAYGVPDVGNQRRMREKCEADCIQLRVYGNYGVPEQVDKKEDRECKEIKEKTVNTVAETVYTRIFTQSHAFLSSISADDPVAAELRKRLEALDYEGLTNSLIGATQDEVVEQFYSGLGNTARDERVQQEQLDREFAKLIAEAEFEEEQLVDQYEPWVPVNMILEGQAAALRPVSQAVVPDATREIQVVVAQQEAAIPAASSVIPVVRPAIVPQAQVEALRMRGIREADEKAQRERGAIEREREAARQAAAAAQRAANLNRAREYEKHR